MGLSVQEEGAGCGGTGVGGGGSGWEGVIRKGRLSLALPVGCRGRGMSLMYPALCSSCVSPGGTGSQKLAQLPELASAEMSLHAIYLHQVSGKVRKEKCGEKAAAQKEAEEG